MNAARSPGASASPPSAAAAGKSPGAGAQASYFMTAVAQGRALPSDVVAALYGSAHVRLRGFAQHARAPSFLRPGMQFVSASISMEELRTVLIARGRRTRIILWAALVCTHVAVAAGAALWWSQQAVRHAQGQAFRAGSAVVASWTVVSVNPAGVLLRMGAESGSGAATGPGVGTTISVPVGGRLPNGEILTLVDATRGLYVTPSSRTFLAAPPGAAPRP